MTDLFSIQKFSAITTRVSRIFPMAKTFCSSLLPPLHFFRMIATLSYIFLCAIQDLLCNQRSLWIALKNLHVNTLKDFGGWLAIAQNFRRYWLLASTKTT